MDPKEGNRIVKERGDRISEELAAQFDNRGVKYAGVFK
jgi:hypothetical protein